MTKPKGDLRTSHIRGEQHHSWRGGRQASGNGAVHVIDHGNPRADDRGRVYEHIAVAERALGHPLPPQAVVHHVDRDRKHNTPDNLVICEDQAYHLLIHQRLRAYEGCGHPDWFKCVYCKTWDAAENLYVRVHPVKGPNARHRACHAEAVRKRSH